MLNMYSHSVLLLGKSDVFCTKILFLLSPNSFYKKFELTFFFLGLLENIDVFCRKFSEDFAPFPDF